VVLPVFLGPHRKADLFSAQGNARLGDGALQRINTDFSGADRAVSAITFWEISMLVQKYWKNLKPKLDARI
jgi:hypothetical protein